MWSPCQNNKTRPHSQTLPHKNNTLNTCCLNEFLIKGNYPTDSVRVCFKFHVAYEMTFSCSETCFGFTKRGLYVRVKENIHKSTLSNDVFQHHQHCDRNFSISIPVKRKCAVNLRIKETCFITKKTFNFNLTAGRNLIVGD